VCVCLSVRVCAGFVHSFFFVYPLCCTVAELVLDCRGTVWTWHTTSG